MIKSVRDKWGFRLVLLAAVIFGVWSSAAYSGDSVKAMWVWGAETVENPSKQNRLLDFAEAKGVNRLYVGAWSVLEKEPETLAEFIRRSRSRDIEVELLFGERAWAFSRNHNRVLKIVDEVVEFAERYPDARPLGVHLDIEPYSLAQWDEDKNRVANDMVDLFERARARLEGSDLTLVVDIPIWYDDHEITRNGESRPLHELVIDAVDGVALMDYRDSYDRIVDDAANELKYASQQQRNVIVGVETLCIDPPSITFCEEGSDVMEKILDRLDREMSSKYSAYRGHAIHHFDSYREL